MAFSDQVAEMITLANGVIPKESTIQPIDDFCETIRNDILNHAGKWKSDSGFQYDRVFRIWPVLLWEQYRGKYKFEEGYKFSPANPYFSGNLEKNGFWNGSRLNVSASSELLSYVSKVKEILKKDNIQADAVIYCARSRTDCEDLVTSFCDAVFSDYRINRQIADIDLNLPFFCSSLCRVSGEIKVVQPHHKEMSCLFSEYYDPIIRFGTQLSVGIRVSYRL